MKYIGTAALVAACGIPVNGTLRITENFPMKKTITTFFAAGLLAGSLGLVSCDSPQEEAREEQGEAIEEQGEQMEETGEETGNEALEEAGEQMEDSGDAMDDGEGDA